MLISQQKMTLMLPRVTIFVAQVSTSFPHISLTLSLSLSLSLLRAIFVEAKWYKVKTEDT